jgi:Ca2+-transporting ATPase
VPADLRLMETTSLEIEESCITGESYPVAKQIDPLPEEQVPLGDRNNMAFMGTIVTRGRGLGAVVATGMYSTMGEIAKMLEETGEEATPLQRRLDNLGKVLILICIGACLAVMILGLCRGENLPRMVMAGISLAVAAIPEGLPAIVTVVLALGVQRMARRNAVIRRLPAVETLGCTTVICSDKTGTLTQNQMTARRLATIQQEIIVTGEGYEPKGQFIGERGQIKPLYDQGVRLAIEIGYWCNHSELEKEGDHWSLQGDPTEGALLALGKKAGLEGSLPIVREVPFESERKMMTVVVKEGGKYRACVKGALEALMPRCRQIQGEKGAVRMEGSHRAHLGKLQEEWASQAHRVLALAYRDLSASEVKALSDQDLESNLCLVGICGIIDPPRQSAIHAVRDCHRAGIVPVMITGDHPATAVAIARQVGINEGRAVIGPEEIERLTPKALAEKALEVRIFARVSPQHKLKIVKALKSRGEVVAMTGDGVNDAPALKEADIGVAMGISGTEVTKQASAMILADDDFSTIVAAVYEGRAIYDNIRKFIRYLLGCNIGEILTMLMASIIGMPLPLLPIQILWVNLITDGLPAMALGVEPPEPGVMKRKPRSPKESVFSRGLGWSIMGRGVYIGLSTLGILAFGLICSDWNGEHNLALARTMAFTTLVFAQLFYVFECRSEQFSPFELGFFKNPFLIAAVVCSALMQLTVLYLPALRPLFSTVPLQPWHWLVILGITGGKFFMKLLHYYAGKLAGNRGSYGKLVNTGIFSK